MWVTIEVHVYTLYRIFDRADVLLYVGKSTRALHRLGDHVKLQLWARDIATIRLEHFADALALSGAETQAIKNEGPKYNSHQAPWPGPNAPSDPAEFKKWFEGLPSYKPRKRRAKA
jgi:hypothetical protein